MSDDLSGFSLMDLFRSEADGQTALLTEGLLALEGEAEPSPAALESLMRAAHSLKGAARIVGLDAAVRVAHALEDNFVAAQRGEFLIQSFHVDVLLKSVDLLAQIALLSEESSAAWQEENVELVAGMVEGLNQLQTMVVEVDVPLPLTPSLLEDEGGLTQPDSNAAGDTTPPPTLTLPHKGGGDVFAASSPLTPSPLVGEGRGVA
jgi:two-component system sensor histidine kinase and response regulator WspE